ncbi:MAG: threonine ammonia-lyase [Bdellovibrionales bacterium RBG_16_40_8]|nr:MAG: threonine ammonia-lyase [Bdellovibrionales bacterium RBG_16_40_8]
MKILLEDIKKAREVISGVVRKTPLEISMAASQALGSQVYLKCENLQLTGSFKIRGALNKISSLSEAEKKRGVLAVSAGNHAQGVALSSSKLGVKATVVMPRTSSMVKQVATKNYGAEVVLFGETYDEASEYARELEKKSGLVFVHPFEDPHIIAGQGTLGLEIYESLPAIDSIVVPIGGGGLISGIAIALKSLKPSVKVYGVVAENAPGMLALFNKQKVPTDASGISVADGIAVKKPSAFMCDNFIAKYVDDVMSVSEDEMAEAIVFLLERSKMVAEGAGAVSVAASFRKKWDLGDRTVLLISGGNIDLHLVGEILDRGLSRKGRVARISVVVIDRPGTLSKLAKIIGDMGANILDVTHDRMHPSLQVREALISFVLETKDSAHAEEIRHALQSSGIRLG